MRLKIDVEIPQWTSWLASGIALGLVLGVGASRVGAGTVTVKTWATGDTLTAADLNANFANIRAAIDQLQHPDCPIDYTRDMTGPADIVLCRRGLDEVVKVGTGGTAFWIDRYEASVFSDTMATGTQYGLVSEQEFPASYPQNGQFTTKAYALSVSGKRPSAFVTWFQAQMVCRLSGKRLPSGEEWQAAAVGTQDAGSHDATGGFCVTNSTGPRITGLGTACVSFWGAQDMIGNLWEWTEEWQAGLGTSGVLNQWPSSAYNGDVTWNIESGGYDGAVSQPGLPVAALRGGFWGDGEHAGLFALALNDSVTRPMSYTGFRCVQVR